MSRDKGLNCGFTIELDKASWTRLTEDEKKTVIDAFETHSSNVGTWGSDFIAGTVSSDVPGASESDLKRDLVAASKSLPRRKLDIIKDITIDECDD